MEDRKKHLKCDVPEGDWLLEQRDFCDDHYADVEMNLYCHGVVDREGDRRRKICAEPTPASKERQGTGGQD
jgi:hypothetical protein